MVSIVTTYITRKRNNTNTSMSNILDNLSKLS